MLISKAQVLLKANDEGVVCSENNCHRLEEDDSTDESSWISTPLVVIGVGGITGALSLLLQLFVFWPAVLFAKKAMNVILLVCRVIDFFGAPTKFIGAFWILWYLPEINDIYSWRKYPLAVQIDPLPIGLVLFSYILQTLCFAAATVAMDKGAKGFDTHLEIIKKKNLAESLEAAEMEEYKRVSYQHPIGKSRSSKLLSEVADHFPSVVLKSTGSNV